MTSPRRTREGLTTPAPNTTATEKYNLVLSSVVSGVSMVLSQDPKKFVPKVLISLAMLGGAALLTACVTFWTNLGASPVIPALLVGATAILAYCTWLSLKPVLRPAVLVLDEHGFTLDQGGKSQSWAWETVANLRRHADRNAAGDDAALAFDVAHPADGRRPVVVLPGGWAVGAERVLDELGAARRRRLAALQPEPADARSAAPQ
jgi:hypothetical protein